MKKKIGFLILSLGFLGLNNLYAQESGTCSLTGQPFKGSVCEEIQLKAQKGNPSFQNVPQFNYNPQSVQPPQGQFNQVNQVQNNQKKQIKSVSGPSTTLQIKKKEEKVRPLFQFPEDAMPAEELSKNSFIVRPEKTTIVRLSNSDINRIVCTEDLSREVRVVFPQRKGVNVKVVDNNVFVEFQVIKEGEDNYIYQETPVEFYVMCDDSVYSIIGIPQRVPAVTIYLKNDKKELSKKVSALSGMPYEERIVNIVRSIFSGESSLEASVVKVSKKYDVIPALEIEEVENFVYDAEGLIAKVFMVRMKDNVKDSYVDLREKDFLKKELTARPQAVAIEKLRLLKGEKTMVVILEKASVIEKVNPGQGLLMGQ